jgi:hypothetical protein
MKKPAKKVRPRPVMSFLRRQQVLAFYTLVRDGAYTSRKQEREAVEEMFLAAGKAGVIK